MTSVDHAENAFDHFIIQFRRPADRRRILNANRRRLVRVQADQFASRIVEIVFAHVGAEYRPPRRPAAL